MMKWKYSIPLALVLALGWSGMTEAAEPAALAGGALPTVSHLETVQNSLATVVPNGTYSPLLPKVKWPKGTTYQSIPLPGLSSEYAYAGTVLRKGKKADTLMLALGAETKGPKADEAFGGMFIPGGYTQEAGKKMLAFNMGLLRSENLLNEVFLKIATNTRHLTGQPLPYDLVAMDMLSVEQLHRVKTMKDTYTFALRPLVVVDGYTVPLYVRGVAAKRDDTYQFLCLAGLDNSRDVVNQTVWEVLR